MKNLPFGIFCVLVVTQGELLEYRTAKFYIITHSKERGTTPMKAIVCSVLSILIFSSFSLTTAHAGTDAIPTYNQTTGKNHGHVGIHQRREELRERIAKGSETNPAVTDIAPAAGTEETGTQAPANPPQQKETPAPSRP